MAIPPEPIDEMLPMADAVVIARVVQIVHRDQQAFVPEVQLGVADTPRELPLQIVSLDIQEVLSGEIFRVGQIIEVLKPPGAYALRPDVTGPFLLMHREGDPRPIIIGRYGPDSYSLHVIKAAITKHNR
jgi:hypothetical protein